MRNILSTILILILGSSALAKTTTEELDHMCSQMLTAAKYDLRGDIVEDSRRASGLAAVASRGNYARIFVDSNALRRVDRNSWAFIMGHELSHVIRGDKHGSAEAEWQADLMGARLAQAVGYSIEPYISWLYSNPNHCSMSHGCLHGRAKNLERHFGLNSGRYNKAHDRHQTALEFPSAQQIAKAKNQRRNQTRLGQRFPRNESGQIRLGGRRPAPGQIRLGGRRPAPGQVRLGGRQNPNSGRINIGNVAQIIRVLGALRR